MSILYKILQPIFNLIYHNRIPFEHSDYDLFWHLKYRFKNFLKYRTFDFFYKVELEVCTQCNRKCSYCPNSVHPKKSLAMEIDLYKKIIRDLVEISYSGIVAFHLFNEPLLDGRLADLVKYARNLLPKAYLLIYTNGDLLDHEKFSELVKNGVNKFYITQHESIPPMTFLSWYNEASLVEKKSIIFRKMDSNSTLSNRGGLVEIKNKKKFDKCLTPKINLVVDVLGNVLLCHHDFFSKHAFGNVKEESLIKIWNSKKYKEARKEKSQGVFKNQMCQKCKS